jgi:SHS2 domain-containing protein
MADGTYEIEARGADAGLRVAGADLGACLAAAVAGFAAMLVEGPVAAPTRREALAIDEASAPELLVALIDDLIVRLDTDGELAVALDVAEAANGRLRGRLELCALTDVAVHGVAPKAATWHDVRLEPGPDGWSGRIMIDL